MWALVHCQGLDYTELDHCSSVKAHTLSSPADKYGKNTISLLNTKIFNGWRLVGKIRMVPEYFPKGNRLFSLLYTILILVTDKTE